MYGPGDDAVTSPHLHVSFMSLRTNTPLVIKMEPNEGRKVCVCVCVCAYVHIVCVRVCEALKLLPFFNHHGCLELNCLCSLSAKKVASCLARAFISADYSPNKSWGK